MIETDILELFEDFESRFLSENSKSLQNLSIIFDNFEIECSEKLELILLKYGKKEEDYREYLDFNFADMIVRLCVSITASTTVIRNR